MGGAVFHAEQARGGLRPKGDLVAVRRHQWKAVIGARLPVEIDRPSGFECPQPPRTGGKAHGQASGLARPESLLDVDMWRRRRTGQAVLALRQWTDRGSRLEGQFDITREVAPVIDVAGWAMCAA